MTALLLRFWPYIVAVGAAIFGAWKIRQSGVNSERAKQAAEEARARDIKDEVQNDVGAMSPDHVRAELAKRAAR